MKMSADTIQHTNITTKEPVDDELLTTNSNKNPIYDSIEDDVEQLEQMICSEDTNFNSVTKEVWRDVVSPSSSISSINSSDSDDDDFSGFISLSGSYSVKEKPMKSNNNNSNFCDKLSNEEDDLNESRVSLQDINMQIGIAEELISTPNSRAKQCNKHLFGNLETIHEGKFLYTPPKNATEKSPRSQLKMSNANFLDRLVRE